MEPLRRSRLVYPSCSSTVRRARERLALMSIPVSLAALLGVVCLALVILLTIEAIARAEADRAEDDRRRELRLAGPRAQPGQRRSMK